MNTVGYFLLENENTVLVLLQYINSYARVVVVVWFRTRRYKFL